MYNCIINWKRKVVMSRKIECRYCGSFNQPGTPCRCKGWEKEVILDDAELMHTIGERFTSLTDEQYATIDALVVKVALGVPVTSDDIKSVITRAEIEDMLAAKNGY